VIRGALVAALVLLLQAGTTVSLLIHVHADGEAAHHREGRAHAHLGSVPSHGARVDHQEGRAMARQVFLAVAPDGFDAAAVAPPVFVLAVPVQPVHSRVPHVAHAHDPPLVDGSPSRAPPAFRS
jgi:hypothetical protein